jgi:hypothetical protein
MKEVIINCSRRELTTSEGNQPTTNMVEEGISELPPSSFEISFPAALSPTLTTQHGCNTRTQRI